MSHLTILDTIYSIYIHYYASHTLVNNLPIASHLINNPFGFDCLCHIGERANGNRYCAHFKFSRHFILEQDSGLRFRLYIWVVDRKPGTLAIFKPSVFFNLNA